MFLILVVIDFSLKTNIKQWALQQCLKNRGEYFEQSESLHPLIFLHFVVKISLIWITLKSMNEDKYFEQSGHSSRIQKYSEWG